MVLSSTMVLRDITEESDSFDRITFYTFDKVKFEKLSRKNVFDSMSSLFVMLAVSQCLRKVVLLRFVSIEERNHIIILLFK
jgi:hypothetical protein